MPGILGTAMSEKKTPEAERFGGLDLASRAQRSV
jgi:hypothetical protein